MLLYHIRRGCFPMWSRLIPPYVREDDRTPRWRRCGCTFHVRGETKAGSLTVSYRYNTTSGVMGMLGSRFLADLASSCLVGTGCDIVRPISLSFFLCHSRDWTKWMLLSAGLTVLGEAPEAVLGTLGWSVVGWLQFNGMESRWSYPGED